jgi:hypothetical protein
MKPILKTLKAGLFILFWPIITIILNIFIWTCGRWYVQIPSVRRRIERLKEKQETEWNRVTSIFDKPTVGGVIRTFAENHSMHLDTYYHEGHDWSLIFARKTGGVAKIEVVLKDIEKEKFSITAMWWVDTWADETRHTTQATIADHISIDGSDELRKKLEAAVVMINRWGKDDLTNHYPDMGWQKSWGTVENFEAAGMQYKVLDI